MTISPKNYNILFQPNLQKFTYTGRELFTFTVNEPTKEITLDSVDLKITSCVLTNEKTNKIKTTLNSSLVLTFDKELAPGDYTVEINFEGKINDGLAGWYRSKYEHEGKTGYIATTHFEAADARRTFPCIDHPSHKATFDISFLLDKNLIGISNTEIVKEEPQNGKKLVTFATTPIMSTYLVYLGVGEFEYLEDKYKNVIVRGITTPGKKEYTKFSIECAKNVLGFFEQYFDYQYPLKKLDLLAIPDFAAGAMENWGAITFRENVLLFYEGKSSITTKQRIAEVVAHELAHQWFGNLVTMKWWDDLWLNESFATFMAYKAIDSLWPEWKMWNQYVTDTVFAGMSLDSLQTSHPIQVTVNNVDEIDELFDEIAYDKGGSILRMLDGYLGQDKFRGGLRHYISTFKYQNTQGKDLWNSLEKASKKPVIDLMQSFITQIGFPIISGGLSEKELTLKQSRFLFKAKQDSQKWIVPVVTHDGTNEYKTILKKDTGSVKFDQEKNFIFLNKNYSGFYVSEYSQTLLNNLGKNIYSISNIERVGLLHDLYYLVISNKTKLHDFVSFIEQFMQNETDNEVLMYMIGKLSSIYFLIPSENVKKLIITFSKKAIKQSGYEPKEKEEPSIPMLRSSSLYALSLFDDKETLEFATNKFKTYLKNDASLHPDLRNVVYSIAVWADDGNYKTVKNLYEKSNIQEEKAKFLMALGNTKNSDLLNKTFEYALSEHVRFAHFPYISASLARNPRAKELTFKWFLENWDELMKRSGGMAQMILRRTLKMIIPVGGLIYEKEARAFLKNNREENLAKTFDQTLEELEINLAFIRNNTT